MSRLSSIRDAAATHSSQSVQLHQGLSVSFYVNWNRLESGWDEGEGRSGKFGEEVIASEHVRGLGGSLALDATCVSPVNSDSFPYTSSSICCSRDSASLNVSNVSDVWRRKW